MKIAQIILLVVFFASSVLADEVDWHGKKVSIVGDSYSAYKDTPGCLGAYYPGKTTVQSSQDMWWSRVIVEFGGELEKNCSQSGSDITVTWGLAQSFLYRAKDGQLGNPDVILIMGGLNDFWLHDNSRSSFKNGVNRFFDCLDTEYLTAEKILVLNKIHQHIDYRWGLAPHYRKVLRDLASERGYRLVDIEGWLGLTDDDFDAKTTQHPTLQGQRKIADCVISSLKSKSKYSRLLDSLSMDDRGYMLTDYVPNMRTTRIEVYSRQAQFDCLVTNVLYSTSGFVSLTNALDYSFSLMWRNGSLRYDIPLDSGQNNIGPRFGISPEESDAVVHTETEGQELILDGFPLAGAGDVQSVAASGSLVIGAIRDQESSDYSGMGRKTIYRIVVSEGDEIVHEYVPCLDLQGRATLYDKVDDCCLAVYGGGEFSAYDFDGTYVNYRLYKSYKDLNTAYDEAEAGDTIHLSRQPDCTVSVTGRVDVSINTRGFGNVSMLSPTSLYRVVRNGDVLSLVEVDNITPRFKCSCVSELFTPIDGKLKFHIDNIVEGCYYNVYYAYDINGPWTQLGDGFELERAAYEMPAQDTDQFFVKAVMKDAP